MSPHTNVFSSSWDFWTVKDIITPIRQGLHLTLLCESKLWGSVHRVDVSKWRPWCTGSPSIQKLPSLTFSLSYWCPSNKHERISVSRGAQETHKYSLASLSPFLLHLIWRPRVRAGCLCVEQLPPQVNKRDTAKFKIHPPAEGRTSRLPWAEENRQACLQSLFPENGCNQAQRDGPGF